MRRGREGVLRRLGAALDERGLEHDAVLADGPDGAARLARQAVEDGERFVVVVGGDSTLNGVLNGLLDVEAGARAPDLVLGVVPAGEAEFARTFGLDRPAERLAAHLDGEALYPIDVGRVRLQDRAGSMRTRLFANVAEVGFGAVVTGQAARLPRLLGRARPVVAGLIAVRRSRRVETTVALDHATTSEPVTNVVVANGQFRGGKVAPRALPDDGRFNVQVWRGPPADVFRMLPRVRVGEHMPDPQVREWQSATVEVDSADALPVAADGLVLGTTPARFDLLPRAVSLKV